MGYEITRARKKAPKHDIFLAFLTISRSSYKILLN